MAVCVDSVNMLLLSGENWKCCSFSALRSTISTDKETRWVEAIQCWIDWCVDEADVFPVSRSMETCQASE